MAPVVHEPAELVLIEVKDSAGLAPHAPHRPHCVGNGRGPVATQDRIDVRDAQTTVDRAFELHCDHAVLACDQGTGVQGLLVVA